MLNKDVICIRNVTTVGSMYFGSFPSEQIAVCSPTSAAGLLKGSQTNNFPLCAPVSLTVKWCG